MQTEINKDRLYQIALTLVQGIGAVQAKLLLQNLSAEEIFKAKPSSLEKIDGIGRVRANSIRQFNDFARVEKELAFLKKHDVGIVFLTDPQYPRRLLNCYDSPTVLFYRGDADLNASKMLAVIGTRSHTEYGKRMAEQLIQDLTPLKVTIVSGLAFGIDAIAHKTALKQELPTLGVLGHGLDQLYPSQHRGLAKEMLTAKGALLTEFPSGTLPDKHNFPLRNRIVAGMTDATIVIETGAKGGSMITAELSNSYNRDVFAFPGKVTDPRSAGCNELIRQNKAVLITKAEELIDLMGWQETNKPARDRLSQRQLFVELTAEEKLIVDIIKEKEAVHIDEINWRSGLSSSTVAAAILNLELQNIILSQPGKRYGLQ